MVKRMESESALKNRNQERTFCISSASRKNASETNAVQQGNYKKRKNASSRDGLAKTGGKPEVPVPGKVEDRSAGRSESVTVGLKVLRGDAVEENPTQRVEIDHRETKRHFLAFDVANNVAHVEVGRIYASEHSDVPDEFELFSYSQTNGIRKVQPLASTLQLPGGIHLRLGRLPNRVDAESEIPRTFFGWGKESRARWEEGQPAATVKEMIDELKDYFTMQLYFPEQEREGRLLTLATFTILTYLYTEMSGLPILCASGPKGSGKSTMLSAMSKVVFRPLVISSSTEAAVLLQRECFGGTILIDEAGQFYRAAASNKANRGIRNAILNSYKPLVEVSHKEGKGKSGNLCSYRPYGPTVLAAIDTPDKELESRCIVFPFRAKPDSFSIRLDSKEQIDKASVAIRDKLYPMILEHGPEILKQRITDTTLANREFEIWNPLLKIAKASGDEDYSRLKEVAAAESSSNAEDGCLDPPEAALLRTLRQFRPAGKRPTSDELLKAARADDPESFNSTWRTETVGKRMEAFQLGSKKTNCRREYKQSVEEIEAIMRAYRVKFGDTASQ